ncbi:MAG: D-lactate dehydrogenase [Parcubacteria group bacterium Gr01-1014_38]|nr:MAG: D-lactate dehydrogenase [Parcubacteria group bacterium Gr01-1014_38]
MTLAFFEEEAVDREKLRTLFPREELLFIPELLGVETAPAAQSAEVVSTFVRSAVNTEVLRELPKLKFLTSRSMGTDHIDLKTCAERGIIVSRVPAYGENTVAEHTFALILALSRKIFQSYERTERMKFNREGLRGFDLAGKTLGVIGVGKIGRNVCRIARQGFQMQILAYDVQQDPALAAELGFTYVANLDELLSQSDVITLHAPYLPSTHHLISLENIAKVKKGAVLVNTARGALVDTQALLWALNEGILQGAGLDVLEEENFVYEEAELLINDVPAGEDLATVLRNHILVERDDVIVTPHNAFNSHEAVARIFDTTVENIQAFLAGKPVNVVKAKD